MLSITIQGDIGHCLSAQVNPTRYTIKLPSTAIFQDSPQFMFTIVSNQSNNVQVGDTIVTHPSTRLIIIPYQHVPSTYLINTTPINTSSQTLYQDTLSHTLLTSLQRTILHTKLPTHLHTLLHTPPPPPSPPLPTHRTRSSNRSHRSGSAA